MSYLGIGRTRRRVMGYVFPKTILLVIRNYPGGGYYPQWKER